MRRWLRWLGWGLLAGLLTLVGFLLFVLYTETGLSWLLTSGLRGSGGSFEASAVRGNLASGYEIDNAVIELPAVRISAKQIRVEVRPYRLLRGVLQVDSLLLDEAVYTIKPAPADPGERQPLPKLDLPFDLLLRQLELRNNAVELSREQPELSMDAPRQFQFSAGAEEISIISGKLGVKGLAFSHGEFAVSARGAVDTLSGWAGEIESEGEWSLPEVAHRARLKLAGDTEKVDLGFQLGEGGAVVNLEARFDRPLDAAGIDGRLRVDAFDPKSFGLDLPFKRLDLDLEFLWSDSRLDVGGPISVDGQPMDLRANGLALRGETLEIGGFMLSSPQIGMLSGSGEWPLAAGAPPGKLTLETKGLWLGDWRVPPVGEVPRITTKLDLTGHLEQWQAQLAGSWTLGERAGKLQLSVDGNDQRLLFAPSRIEMGTSAIDLSGELKLDEAREFALDLALEAVDPALFVAEWPGLLNGKVRLSGALGEVPRWRLDVESLTGQLRELPIDAHGSIAGAGTAIDLGDLELAWGGAGARLSVPSEGELAVDLTSFDLRQLGPYEGLVSGQLSWRPEEDLLATSRASLQIDKAAFAGVRIASARITKRTDFEVDVLASKLAIGKFDVDNVRLTSTGTAAAHELAIVADTARARLELALRGAWIAPVWDGAITRVELAETGGATWRLDQPAGLRFESPQLVLQPLCLSAGDARLCAGVNRDENTTAIDLRSTAFPLAQLNAWFPDSGMELAGKLEGGGRVTLSADGKTGGALDFTVREGSVRGAGTYEQAIPFDGSLRFDSAAGALAARLRLPDHGSVELSATGLGSEGSSACADTAARIRAEGEQVDGEPALQASGAEIAAACGSQAQVRARVDITDLSFVDGVTAEIQSVRGSLKGELSGPLNDPLAASGSLESSGLQFELPALGLRATSGKVTATLTGNRQLALDGRFAIAPGELILEGVVGLGDGALTELRIRANNAGLIDLPAVRLAGDTNFVVTRRDGGYAIDGGILLRGGRIDLDRFAPEVPPSEDVFIEDAPPVEPGPPIHADVSIAFIQAVDLRGYGLEGTLGGGLRITQRPGSRTLAQGELTATGVYNAYGQKLNIEKGRLVFSGGRADNPRLDILAVKRVNRQRVGVRVRGNAQRPLATLYSDPSLDQSETLAYLVLGRPLATASGADGQRLGEYADALETAGGNLIAGSIGKRLGLSAGVESLGSAIGSALVVGKYLSPRFFVGYGTTLLDATTLVILRYQITENIDFEIISGREQKASVSWRTER